MSEKSFQPSIVSFVVAFSSDVEKSTNFWKEISGFEAPFPNSSQWASLHPKGSTFDVKNHTHRETAIGIHKAAKDDPNCAAGKVHLNFVVHGIDKFHEFLVARKDVEVIQPPKKEPWGGREASYKSPDGIFFDVVDAKIEEEHPQDEASQPTAKKQKTEHENCHAKEKDPKEAPSCPFGVCHVDLPVQNLKRAEKFYTDAFGWEFTSWKDDYSLFNSKSKEHPLAGGFSVNSKRFEFPFLYISTPTIKQGVEKLKIAGAKNISQVNEIPQVGFNIEFEDSEGNKLYLWSKIKE